MPDLHERAAGHVGRLVVERGREVDVEDVGARARGVDVAVGEGEARSTASPLSYAAVTPPGSAPPARSATSEPGTNVWRVPSGIVQVDWLPDSVVPAGIVSVLA